MANNLIIIGCFTLAAFSKKLNLTQIKMKFGCKKLLDNFPDRSRVNNDH